MPLHGGSAELSCRGTPLLSLWSLSAVPCPGGAGMLSGRRPGPRRRTALHPARTCGRWAGKGRTGSGMYVTWGKSPRFHPDPCRQHGRPSRHDPEPCHSYGHEHRPAARVSALHRVQRSAPPFGEGGALRVHCDQPVTSAGSTWCCSATVARCRCGAGRSLPLVTVDGGGTGASARPTTTSIPHSRSAPTSSVKSFNAVRGVAAMTATSERRAALTRLVR